MNIVLLFSGGLDSTVLLYKLRAEGNHLACLTVDYGQRHAKEIAGARKIAGTNGCQHRILDLSGFGTLLKGSRSSLVNPTMEIPEGHYEAESMKATVVPNRNMILLAAAAAWAISERFDAVAYAAHGGDHAIYPDCRPEFYKVIHEAFAVGNWDSEKVDLYLPYLEGDKLTILRDAQESIAKLGLDFNTVFRNTSTSYDTDDQGRASGKTGSDVERILAFHELGVPDPVPYAEPWEVVLQNALDLEEKQLSKTTP